MTALLLLAVLLQTSGQAADAEKADPVVCRREAPIGSHVPGRRVCRKRSEWAAKSTRVGQDGRVVPQWQGNAGFSPRN
ncbi:hypothetical protein [Sphingomonas lenta]|uniref:Secreted protein n=1 Tax=Sphingomonas lenta TaxID=1141887 RepID=A0A2A2SEK2_9SPHN|nr:hypothetical protein [Sphingomonas lenta]PAX07643.1 hypothetical protein CKY28_08315 [Sphingomonas lenta]